MAAPDLEARNDSEQRQAPYYTVRHGNNEKRVVVTWSDQIPSIIDQPESDRPDVYLVYLTHFPIIDGVIEISILPFYLSQLTSWY